MRIDDKKITDRLIQIRRKIGADKAIFILPPPSGPVNKDLPTSEDVEAIFHPSGLLIHARQPVFAYIRDHTQIKKYSNGPEFRNKIHFTVCETLTNMKQKGRIKRYRITNRNDNRYLVDIKRRGRSSEELDGQLYPCKHCLANVAYHCYHKGLSDSDKNKIVREFDAKEALRLLWRQFDIFRRQTAEMNTAMEPTGYADNFPKISRAFRQLQKFTCEQCGVNLDAYQHLVDTHHGDGDKSNNKYDNLHCLCKLCHAEKHPHYKPPPMNRQIIKAEREKQGISN